MTSPISSIIPTEITIGLTTDQAARAPKNIAKHQITTIELALRVIWNQIASFFFALLIISGLLSFFMHESIDAFIFFAIAGVNAIIGFFQEFHASRSAQALESLIAHTVTVRRDGALISIPSSDVVLGDIVMGAPGSIIVADLQIREAEDLFLDESLLTGESAPQAKVTGDMLTAGSSIVQGSMVGQVIAVGADSSLFAYSKKISDTRKNSSFDTFVTRVSRFILWLTVGCLALVLIGNVLITQSMLLPDFVLYAISMLVGVVPESLPLIITIILTREVLALSRQHVIVKKISVLENLGSMDCLFTDKTGTITENKLRMVRTIDYNHLDTCLSCIATGAYERTPMDQAFDTAIISFIQPSLEAKPLQLSPFQIARGYSIYTLADGTEIIRGQYAMVEKVCQGDNPAFREQCLTTEQSGLRVIAFASRPAQSSEYFLAGAAIFSDPLKPDAVETYQTLQHLGINTKIITGDSTAVAASVGVELDANITTGNIFSMDEWKPDGTDAIEDYRIYARCQPEQKSELIDEHLDHHVVGFLGEGINDALALKRADIGFVVNNASDVARQSGDVLLLEKSLSPVIRAIALSRRAFVHIRTYLLCTLAGNLGTLISLTAVVVLWQQIPMLPIQILLNNLLTDIPLILLITDRINESVLRRPIRDEAGKFFKMIFIFALLSSLFDFAFFFLFKQYDITILRTGWFVFSVIAELTLVFSLRSELPILKSPKISRPLLIVLIACYIGALTLPFISFGSLFHLVPLSLVQIGTLLTIAIVYLFGNEAIKYFLLRRK